MSLYDVFGKLADDHNLLKQIDKVHYEIHEGGHYTASYSTSGTAGSTTYFIVQLASTAAIPHFVPSISADVLGTYSFSIDATVSSSYTAITPYNNHLRSTKTSVLNVGVMPTSSGASTATYGTIVDTQWVGGTGVGVNKISGTAGGRVEWVLKNTTKYCVRFTSTLAYNVSFNTNWYED